MVLIRRPRDGAVLVQGEPDADGEVSFERPLGGHIEQGERAADTLRREIREEIGQELCQLRQLAVLENLFELEGAPGHEIVFVFEAAFVDPAAYEIEDQPVRDQPGVRVWWRRPGDRRVRLVPEEFARLVEREPDETGSSTGHRDASARPDVS